MIVPVKFISQYYAVSGEGFINLEAIDALMFEKAVNVADGEKDRTITVAKAQIRSGSDAWFEANKAFMSAWDKFVAQSAK